MTETLGSLCDKLTIVKLKQYHDDKKSFLNCLLAQERQLVEEINKFAYDAVIGEIPTEKLIFEANKIFKKNGNETREISGGLAETFAELAKVNCDLWHKQEKVYDFESVPLGEKDKIVKSLAILNLERNKCIDRINMLLKTLIETRLSTK